MRDHASPAHPHRAAPRRQWLVLLLLVGLFGMHGLTSNHAGMATATEAPPVASAAGIHRGMTGMDKVVPPAAGTDHEAAPPAPAPAKHGGMTMVGLCLAVLAGVLLLATARPRLSGRERPDHRNAARLVARARALPAPRPPDLVAGLCMSRT